MPSSATLYGLSEPGLLLVLMALPPVTYERRFGLSHPPLLPILMSWFPLAENQHHANDPQQ
jgi:hypothetical protein